MNREKKGEVGGRNEKEDIAGPVGEIFLTAQIEGPPHPLELSGFQ